jgi:outer membrane biosynthesis protein TonB
MDTEEVDAEQQGWSKYQAIFVIVPLLVLVGITAKMASGNHVSSHRENLMLVSLNPPPPPPPPPQSTPPPPQEEQKMEQPMIKEAEAKSEPPKDEPPLGTGIKGEGTDSYGLSDKAGNGRIGGTAGNGSRWGWYSSQVAALIQAAMQRNRKTRSANLSVDVRVWPDSSGRLSRAQLTRSTGDPNIDNALRDEVLTGLPLQEPPPAGMPVPIVLHITARQPR